MVCVISLVHGVSVVGIQRPCSRKTMGSRRPRLIEDQGKSGRNGVGRAVSADPQLPPGNVIVGAQTLDLDPLGGPVDLAD